MRPAGLGQSSVEYADAQAAQQRAVTAAKRQEDADTDVAARTVSAFFAAVMAEDVSQMRRLLSTGYIDLRCTRNRAGETAAELAASRGKRRSTLFLKRCHSGQHSYQFASHEVTLGQWTHGRTWSEGNHSGLQHPVKEIRQRQSQRIHADEDCDEGDDGEDNAWRQIDSAATAYGKQWNTSWKSITADTQPTLSANGNDDDSESSSGGESELHSLIPNDVDPSLFRRNNSLLALTARKISKHRSSRSDSGGWLQCLVAGFILCFLLLAVANLATSRPGHQSESLSGTLVQVLSTRSVQKPHAETTMNPPITWIETVAADDMAAFLSAARADDVHCVELSVQESTAQSVQCQQLPEYDIDDIAHFTPPQVEQEEDEEEDTGPGVLEPTTDTPTVGGASMAFENPLAVVVVGAQVAGDPITLSALRERVSVGVAYFKSRSQVPGDGAYEYGVGMDPSIRRRNPYGVADTLLVVGDESRAGQMVGMAASLGVAPLAIVELAVDAEIQLGSSSGGFAEVRRQGGLEDRLDREIV
jgi:hypothetical protein